MITIHKIIEGDCRRMAEIDNNSVHLIITSPPYWQLKDYGHEEQIGFNDTYEDYINNLNLVWKECFRVLHDGCRLCINIGDQFARAIYYGRYKVIPIREEIIRFCETIGFDYMGAIIWQKVTTSNTTGGGIQMGSYPYPRNGILKIDYEFILLFKKLGKPPLVDKQLKENSKMTPEEWNIYFNGHWKFAGAKQDKHIAVFPEELPKRIIKMFSFVGDIILDPFAGSGTTALASKNLNRNSISYEINKEYISVIRDKLEINQNDIHGTQFEFLKQIQPSINYEKEVEKLPYKYQDPHKLNNKIDIKKLQFGSRIDSKSQTKRDDLYTINHVLSSSILVLNNNLKIRLIGVKELPSLNNKAIEYLVEKTKGKKVFMKYDNNKYDDNGTLYCYLYLQNKTFINAHLIKNGYVDVDISIEYVYKNKFLKLKNNGY